jgi:hypothetical protein
MKSEKEVSIMSDKEEQRERRLFALSCLTQSLVDEARLVKTEIGANGWSVFRVIGRARKISDTGNGGRLKIDELSGFPIDEVIEYLKGN